MLNQKGFTPIFLVLGVVLCIVITFLYIHQKYQFTGGQITRNYQILYDQSKKQDREEIFKKLTANSWGCPERQMGPGPDFQRYTYSPDGTYTIQHITDYPITPQGGKWNFEKGANGDWFLLYDDGTREHFTFNGNELVINTQEIEACKNDQNTNHNEVSSADTLPKIVLSEKINAIDQKITSQKWKKANDLNLDITPSGLEFKNDWQYVSTWHNGQCQNTGSWYATEKGVSGDSLTDNCDHRNDPYPESFQGALLPDGNLSLYNDLFVPESTNLNNRGEIYNSFSYSNQASINILYDMPIKSGIPNNFAVEITNTGTDHEPGPLTLQRFSLTQDYVRDYRVSQTTISSVKEIVGIDLGSKIIKPGESYKFSLQVTFEKPGSQNAYINSFMFGPTQMWDSHQVYQFNVQ